MRDREAAGVAAIGVAAGLVLIVIGGMAGPATSRMPPADPPPTASGDRVAGIEAQLAVVEREIEHLALRLRDLEQRLGRDAEGGR